MKRLILLLSIFILVVSSIVAQQGDTIVAKQFELKAKELFRSFEFDSAAIYYQKAAEIYEKQKSWLKVAKNYRFATNSLYNASNANTALILIKKALYIANNYFQNKSKDEIYENINILITLGDVYGLLGKYEQDLVNCQKALKIALESDSVTELKIGVIWDEIGFANYNLGLFDKAIEFYKKTLEQRLKILGNLDKKVSDSFNKLGMAFYMKDEHDKAIECFQKDLQITILLEGEYNPSVATCYTNLGVVTHDKGNYDKSLEYYNKALQIELKLLGENHFYIAQLYHNIGVVFYSKGLYEKALGYYQRALQIYHDNFGEAHIKLSSPYTNIGMIHEDNGDYDEALEYYQKALQIEINTYGEKHTSVSISYNKIGSLLCKKGNVEKAISYFNKALEIKLEVVGEKHSDVAEIYDNIAKEYESKNDFINALEYFQKALSIRCEIFGKNNPAVALTYDLVGTLYRNINDYDRANNNYQKALLIKKQYYSEKHPDVARSYIYLGLIKEEIENRNLATSYYQKALIANLPDFNDTIIYVNPKELNAFSKPYLQETLYYKANTLYSLYASSGKSPKDIKTSVETYDLLFQLIYEMRSDYNHEGSQLLLSEETKNYFADAMMAAIEYGKLSNSDEAKGKAFDYLEKSKSATLSAYLNDLDIKSYLNIADSLVEKEKDIVINRRYYETKIQTAKAEKGGYDTLLVQEYEDNLFNYSRQYDSLISALKSEYPEYYQLKYQQQVANINDIQEKLDNNTALLNYFVADTSLFIAAITKNQLVYKIVKTDSSFNQKVIDYYIDIKSEFSKKEVASSAILYQYLIEPVEAIVNTKSKLVIIPDGNLNYLPFETLCKDSVYPNDLSDVDYLIKNHTVSYHQSATLWLNSLEKSKKFVAKNNSFIGFAPVFNTEVNNGYIVSNNWATDSTSANMAFRDVSIDLKHFNALPYSEKEIKSIIKLFGKKRKKAAGYFYKEASEKNFKQQSSNYNYIHIASHSFANDRYPALSGIAFSQPDTTNLSENNNDDGILYATETYNLNLSQADLVVLSSCKSGLGKLIKGEGFMSLSRGFLYSGARNLVYSLWNVNDEATMDLMVDFYKELMHGKDYATALKHAKKKLIKNPAISSPKYWASWVLMGE